MTVGGMGFIPERLFDDDDDDDISTIVYPSILWVYPSILWIYYGYMSIIVYPSRDLEFGDNSIVLTGLQCVGQRVARHVWGALSTASAAFSHSEGDKVPRVAVQSRGQETLTVRYTILSTYFQLGNPAICVHVCGCVAV